MVQSSSLNAQDLRPFGSLTAQSLMNQFLGIARSEDYDAVILLTDQGLYGSETEIDKPLAAPLYFLHIDKAAAAYDDAILDAIYRSGGGVATSVKSLKQQLTFNGPKARVVDDRLWTLKPNGLDVEIPAGSTQHSDLTALAARQIILMESFGKPPAIETLDKLHKLATTHDVVTPYSSMIVLVNEGQKEALKKESEADDRFDREGRSGEEVLSSPNNPLVSGVPEPHEWLLIFVSLLMLIVIWRKRDEWDRGAETGISP
jgi:putative PEP-CTERM system integral membrane protein